MRTTINMDDGVLTEATEYTDIRERMALIHEDLRALVRREATQRLAKLRGKPAATPGYFVAKAKSGETGAVHGKKTDGQSRHWRGGINAHPRTCRVCRRRTVSSSRILDGSLLDDVLPEVATQVLRCAQVDLPPVKEGRELPLQAGYTKQTWGATRLELYQYVYIAVRFKLAAHRRTADGRERMTGVQENTLTIPRSSVTRRSPR